MIQCILKIIEDKLYSLITDASGEAVQHLPPKAFGVPFGESFVTQTSSGWESRYTFSGKEKDVETGYSYFGARYYDSDISVWLSVDPLASQYPSMSAYMYTAGNPMMLVDPDGREFDDPNDVTRARNSQTEARNRVAELNNNIKALESKESLTDSEKQTLADSKDQVKVLEDHVSHLEEMITTKDWKYAYKKVDESSSDVSTYYKNGVVTMEYKESSPNAQAHEEAHGYQYISGALKISGGHDDNSSYDLSDEAEAYKIQVSYVNSERQKAFYNIVNVSEIKGVKDITADNLSKSKFIRSTYPDLVKKHKKSQ